MPQALGAYEEYENIQHEAGIVSLAVFLTGLKITIGTELHVLGSIQCHFTDALKDSLTLCELLSVVAVCHLAPQSSVSSFYQLPSIPPPQTVCLMSY